MATDVHSNSGDNGRAKKENPNEEISLSISRTNRQMLVWLRGLALHPRGKKKSIELNQMLLSRALHIRKCLFLDNIEHRPKKRTRERAQSDGEVCTASGQSSEKSGDPNFQKKGRKLKDSVQCSLSCSSSPQTINLSNASSPKEIFVEDDPGQTVQDAACGSDKSNSDQKFLDSLFHENENVKRPVIPIGPGFQARIPDWIAPTKKGKFYGSPGDSKTLRLLGTDVWPTYSPRKKTIKREIGKGRSDSCSCTSPGSINCIKQHTKEARGNLKTDLGAAFYTWKFDKMGEFVTKSLTLDEERRFESLVKKNPLSSCDDFWGVATKAFPSKSKKTLISYYHNVFLIKRMRSLTKSSADRVDSDDDHNDDFSAG